MGRSNAPSSFSAFWWFMYDACNDSQDWVLPSELWFPNPNSELSGPFDEDPYSPDPYSHF